MVYIENILWGLLVFPLIAAAFTLPYALYQYHKYGSVSKLRTLIIYSFILYMLIAFFMVCLPRTVLFSFLLSLFYEGSQLSALFGIYPGPYRLADVEDLICNTLGGAICRMTLVSDAAARTSKRRRLAGLVSARRSAAGQVSVWRKSSKQIQNGRASAGQLIKRYLYLWLFTELPLVIVTLIAEGRFGFLSDFMIIGLLLLSRAYFVAYFIFEVFRKEAIPMPHDRLSGTTYRSLNSILS